ncbi:hypothetical protein chiPu_0005100 [Chiloscyllium punctatum]|uniref:Uncharacterized protein n=1 Tax=Chiloscyllium punctatum TaxID=137246 RepID=A0A401S8G0_CHIPU|nr:hypothetical protein [Chiloscyllium punctatum]
MYQHRDNAPCTYHNERVQLSDCYSSIAFPSLTEARGDEPGKLQSGARRDLGHVPFPELGVGGEGTTPPGTLSEHLVLSRPAIGRGGIGAANGSRGAGVSIGRLPALGREVPRLQGGRAQSVFVCGSAGRDSTARETETPPPTPPQACLTVETLSQQGAVLTMSCDQLGEASSY